jgi:hypothetical protein
LTAYPQRNLFASFVASVMIWSFVAWTLYDSGTTPDSHIHSMRKVNTKPSANSRE